MPCSQRVLSLTINELGGIVPGRVLQQKEIVMERANSPDPLPSEIMERIFTFLEVRSLVVVNSVCHLWRQIASRTELWWNQEEGWNARLVGDALTNLKLKKFRVLSIKEGLSSYCSPPASPLHWDSRLLLAGVTSANALALWDPVRGEEVAREGPYLVNDEGYYLLSYGPLKALLFAEGESDSERQGCLIDLWNPSDSTDSFGLSDDPSRWVLHENNCDRFRIPKEEGSGWIRFSGLITRYSPEDRVYSLVAGPGGSEFLMYGSDRRRIGVVDTCLNSFGSSKIYELSGEENETLEDGDVTALLPLPDLGGRVVGAGLSTGELFLFDGELGNRHKINSDGKEAVSALGTLSLGRRSFLMSGSVDGVVRFFNLHTFEEFATLTDPAWGPISFLRATPLPQGLPLLLVGYVPKGESGSLSLAALDLSCSSIFTERKETEGNEEFLPNLLSLFSLKEEGGCTDNARIAAEFGADDVEMGEGSFESPPTDLLLNEGDDLREAFDDAASHDNTAGVEGIDKTCNAGS